MWPCAGLFVLVGCGARVLEPEPEGEAGTGGRGGADGGEAGSSGAGDAGNGGDPDASVGGSGPIGGTGSVLGGTGGEVGGTGGVAGDCATSDPAATCSQLSEGWFAVKIALDVWWPGEPVRDPGRGELALTLLARVGDVCSGDSDQTAELKLCDVSLPIATSDVGCEAYELSFDEALWDSARMPRFVTPMERALLLPGEMISLAPWIGLVGIDLFDPADLPTVEQRDSFECASGVGEECFSDHDQDERPGVTMIPRNDKATYVGSLDDGLCTNGAGYRFLATPVTIDITAGGANNPFRASELHVGMRSHAGVAAEIARDCGSAVGSSSGDGFALRASGCMVDPTSLHETDPRRTGDLRCNEDEMFILDMMLPAYRVLQPRETPTDTQPPLGWAMKGRDISKAPSLGPRSALVHLAGLGEAEPSCATVRATAFPDL
jgi:hypothetical protein